MDFQQLHVVEGSSEGTHSAHQSATAAWKPQQQSGATAWQNSFAAHHQNYSSHCYKPPSPEQARANAQSILVVDYSQQINSTALGNTLYFAAPPQVGLASEVQKFGVSEAHYLTQPHQLGVEGNCFAPVKLASGYSARRSPNKSASPTVEDIYVENVSVLANRPKPATPHMQRSSDLCAGPAYQQISRNRMHVADPVELLESEILKNNSTSKVQLTRKSMKVCELGKLKPRMNAKRGKFQLNEKRRSKAFVLSDILSNLPKVEVALKANLGEGVANTKQLRVKQDQLRGGGHHIINNQQLSQNPQNFTSPPKASRPLTRLHCRTQKLMQGQNGRTSFAGHSVNQSSSSSRSRNSGGQVTQRSIIGLTSGPQATKRSTRNFTSRAANLICKERRSLVKLRQNKTRHMQVTQACQIPTNVISAEGVGDLQVAAFERHQVSCAREDGLWQMEKDHIAAFSQNEVRQQSSASPGMVRSHQRRSSQNNFLSPPQSRIAGLSNISDAAHQADQNSLNSMNVVNEMVRGGVHEATQSVGSSSQERELFTIFSGLRVVTMTTTAPVAITGATRATTTFEGDGAAQQAVRPDRPYRWLPTLIMPPGTYPQTRLSSI